MASILPGFEYDIFISYRQNDNKQDGWVAEFVSALKAELEATVKNPVSVYFDENPHDGLLETHQVDKSLARKLKCLIFIPVVSQTYCDTNSFAWQHEFVPFIKMASEDEIGMHIALPNGNVASRVLPIQIHDLDVEDLQTIEKELSGPMRSIPFIYKAAGVNRPLRATDSDLGNLDKTNYRNQINKVANALKEIGKSMVRNVAPGEVKETAVQPNTASQLSPAMETGRVANWWGEVKQRNVLRAGIAYIVVAWLLLQIVESLSRLFDIPQWLLVTSIIVLAVGLPVAVILAWKFEKGPTGFIRAGSALAKESPFGPGQKKPFSSNSIIIGILVLVITLSFSQKYWLPQGRPSDDISIAIIPFQNYSQDENQKNLGVGIASEVRTALSLSKKFQFISSLQATLQYANSKESPKAMGNNLGVTHILSGYYNIAGPTIQVTVELVDAKNGNIIWSLPYKAALANIFNIQEDIASKVLDRFSFEANGPVTIQTTNLPAYAHYLKGIEALNKGWTEEIFKNATQEFESAIRLDSSYVPAWVGLVHATTDWIWEINASDSSLHKKAKKEIKYIHEHFPSSWQTKEADAIYQYHGLSNYDEGLRLFNEVLKEDPENLLANSGAAAIHKRKLEFAQSIKLLTKAKKQWPQSDVVWSEIGEVLFSMGDYEDEAKANEILLELGGTDYGNRRALFAAIRGGQVGKLPAQVVDWVKREHSAGEYSMMVNAEKRNWKAVKNVLDTTKHVMGERMRFSAYYAMGMKDSVRQMAQGYLAAVRKNQSWFDPEAAGMAYAGLGQKTLAIAAMDSLWYNNNNLVKIQKEDLLMQARQKISKVVVISMAGDYKGATELLLSINKDYPNFGDFRWLFTNPVLDRIKAEYAPFNEALSNLKRPQQLVLEELVKR